MHVEDLLLPNLLFEDVHRCLMSFEFFVLEKDLHTKLQRGWQVRVIAEIAFKKEARHKMFPKHRLMKRTFEHDRWLQSNDEKCHVKGHEENNHFRSWTQIFGAR